MALTDGRDERFPGTRNMGNYIPVDQPSRVTGALGNLTDDLSILGEDEAANDPELTLASFRPDEAQAKLGLSNVTPHKGWLSSINQAMPNISDIQQNLSLAIQDPGAALDKAFQTETSIVPWLALPVPHTTAITALAMLQSKLLQQRQLSDVRGFLDMTGGVPGASGFAGTVDDPNFPGSKTAFTVGRGLFGGMVPSYVALPDRLDEYPHTAWAMLDAEKKARAQARVQAAEAAAHQQGLLEEATKTGKMHGIDFASDAYDKDFEAAAQSTPEGLEQVDYDQVDEGYDPDVDVEDAL